MAFPYQGPSDETRCFALVGQFLWHWAHMEYALNEAIEAALKLEGVQRYIVTKNIQFRDKTKILKACVSVALMPEDERKSHQKILRRIADYSSKRNMIAHDFFGPDEPSGGVMFFRVIANDKVEFPETVWSVADFNSSFNEMSEFRTDVLAMKERLKGAHNMQRIAEALLADTQPTEDTLPLGILGLPFP